MLREAGEFPSFVALISSVEEKNEEEHVELKCLAPSVIQIDVDEYLGLEDGIDSMLEEQAENRQQAGGSHALNPVKKSTPQEEGFYTGRVPVSMGDSDPLYLPTIHQLIRNNLEFFSATTKDAAKPQSGRRHPIVEVSCLSNNKFFRNRSHFSLHGRAKSA